MESFKGIFSAIPRPVQLVLATVGALVVGRQVLSGLLFFVNVFILSGINLRKYGPRGSWAVVTGASDGLGKEYASQLASKGFNLILVSRTQSKLDMLALVLKEKYAGLEVRVLAMDYANNDLKDFAKLKHLIDGLDIAILINNVGQSHSIPVPFLSTQVGELQDIVKINCLGTLMTSQTVLPAMVHRKRGLVLTMGSFGGWTPTPYLATYSGSKAFLQQWSSSLAAELKPNGIDVYFVLSYLVVSAMSKVRRPSLLIPTASAFVRSALGKVGRGSQAMAYTYTPFWSHALLQWVVENTIGAGNKLTIWYNLKMHQEIRTRALRKAARNAKKE